MKKIIVNSPKYGIKEILVDDADYIKLSKYKWSVAIAHNTFYAMRQKSPRMMHRLLMGTKDMSISIDHKDGNGLNNQRCNLRECTPSQNNANCRVHKNSLSKYLGVTHSSGNRKKKFQATIKNIFIGRYISEEEAALAYDRAAKKYHGEFANLNFPSLLPMKVGS